MHVKQHSMALMLTISLEQLYNLKINPKLHCFTLLYTVTRESNTGISIPTYVSVFFYVFIALKTQTLSGLEKLSFVFWKKLWKTASRINNWHQNSKPIAEKTKEIHIFRCVFSFLTGITTKSFSFDFNRMCSKSFCFQIFWDFLHTKEH